IYAGDGRGNFYTLRVDAGGVSVAQTISGLLGGDGDPVYAAGLLYSGWGAAIDPRKPSLVAQFRAAGLIRPLPEFNGVLILGGDVPVGYSDTAPNLILFDASTGDRIWTIHLPSFMQGNHGRLIQWGTNGVAFREYSVFGPTNRIHLFRVALKH